MSFVSLPSSKSSTPPLRGSFPLDHDGECKEFMRKYLSCAKEHKFFHEPCKILSQAYLQCRMERELMAPEDLSKWGFEPPKQQQQANS